MKCYCLILLASLLILPSCAQNLQNQIDEQGRSIRLLQKKNMELDRSISRLRDDYQSDVERIRFEIKTMRNTGVQPVQPLQGETVESGASGGEYGQAPFPGQSQPAPPAALTDRDMYNQAYAVYRAADFAKARSAFVDFVKTHPGSQLVSSAQYWIASSYFKEEKYEEAISACDDVIKKYPQAAKTPDAYYLQALSFIEIKDPTTAQIILEELIEKYPATEAASMGKQKYDALKKNN